MKKMICGIAVLVVLFTSCILMVNDAYAMEGPSARAFETCDLYAKTTVVVEVDYEYDLVYCKDFNGEVWCFSGCEDWIVGDIASLLMYNSGTEIIYDDEIVSVTYSGWFDGWEW